MRRSGWGDVAVCAKPGCPAGVQRGYCPKHAPPPKARRSTVPQRHYDELRGSSSARGYGRAWQKARKAYLAAHPLCVQCKRDGLLTAARVVDHIVPHRGDMRLFWDQSNWQALCDGRTGRGCHDRKTWAGR